MAVESGRAVVVLRALAAVEGRASCLRQVRDAVEARDAIVKALKKRESPVVSFLFSIDAGGGGGELRLSDDVR